MLGETVFAEFYTEFRCSSGNISSEEVFVSHKRNSSSEVTEQAHLYLHLVKSVYFICV